MWIRDESGVGSAERQAAYCGRTMMEKNPMLRFVRQTLTNLEVHMPALAYSESRHAPDDSDYSTATSQAPTQAYRAELLMAAQYTIAVVDDDPTFLKALGRLLV